MSHSSEDGALRPKVAVIGLGTLGRSWVAAFCRSGHAVSAYDPDPRQAQALKDQEPSPGAWQYECCETIAEAVDDVQYVQEAASEELTTKREVLRRISEASADAVIGSSSSAIPISKSAADCRRPERCLVVHPANPAHILPVVELVPGPESADEALAFTSELMTSIGMRPIVCRRELPGFVMNRLQTALFREALELARSGVASPADIDACVTEGLALRWAFLGPFGLEGLQSPSLEDRFERYAGYYETMFKAVGGPRGPLEEDDKAVMREGFAAALQGKSHRELAEYRNEMVSSLIELKRASGPGSPGPKASLA